MPKKKDNAEEEDRVFSKATVAAVLGGQGGPYFSAGKLERWSSPRSGHGMLWQEWGLVVLPPTIAAHHAQLKMLWTRSGNLVNVAWDKKRENERKGEGRKKKKKRNSPAVSLVVSSPGCVGSATEAAVVWGCCQT